MTTTTVPITITCPDWCVIDAERHVSELFDMGGECVHHSADAEVADPTGHEKPLEEPRPWEPVTIYWTSSTTPEGREAESPIFRVRGHEMSLDQTLALAEALQAAVAQYRATGGQS